MANSNSSEPVTSGKSSIISSSAGRFNDGPSGSSPVVSAAIAEPSAIRSSSKPSGGARKGGSSKNAVAATGTYQDPPQSGPAPIGTPASATASLPLSTGLNIPSSASTTDAKSYTKSSDNTGASPKRKLAPPVSPPSSSAPSTLRTPSSPTLLRIDASGCAPAPPPKSPRHWPVRKQHPSEPLPPPPPSMGSGQSKPSPSSQSANLPPQQAQRPPQQQRQPQRIQMSNTRARAPSIGHEHSLAANTPPAQLSVSIPPPARAPSPSCKPSTSQSQSQSLHPPAIITSNASQAPSNGQPGTPTSAAGSFGSGATKLMRRFAGRRKKSEDATALFGKGRQQDNGSGLLLQRPSQALLADSAAARKGALVQPSNPLATSQSHSRPKESASRIPPPASILPDASNGTLRPLPSPPTKPAPSVEQKRKLAPPSLDITASGHNRTSVITLSPGITSAVDYMRALPTEREDRGEGKRSGTHPHPILSPGSLVSSPISSPLSSPLVSSSGKEKNVEGVEGKISNETKETWRKSDSTIGHHTIRQTGNTRASRPVSMAESFQSAYTVVPNGGGPGSIGGGNKRWSTLTAEMDFGVMVEEDGEEAEEQPKPCVSSSRTPASPSNANTKPLSPPTAKQQNRRSISLNVDILGSGGSPISPSYVHVNGTNHGGRDAGPLSHSISESAALPASAPKAAYQPSLSGTRTRDSVNTSRAFPHQPQGRKSDSKSPSASSHSQYSSFEQDPQLCSDRSLLRGQQGASSGNLRGRFTAWASGSTNSGTGAPSSSDSSMPPSAMPPLSNSAYAHGPMPTHRPTTVSITSSLAPAAGLARRAAEKLGGMGKKWGLSTSSSGSGYSSSASSRDASLWSSSQSHVDHAQGMPLARTNSNQSSLASSMKSGNGSLSSGFGDIVHRVQLPGKDRKNRRTPNAPSGAYSVTSSVTSASTSDSDAFFASNGPILGAMMKGPVKVKQGNIVFGQDLRSAVHHTRAVLSLSREQGPVGGLVGEWERLAKDVELRKLPALVVRCAQHLLIWGVQEEGLFRVSGRASHVSRLRSEFDMGIDYDLSSCTPGDLDPHAVASIFKAYLRELPEPILTQRLQPSFEAAVSKELETYPPGPVVPTKITTRAPGLPLNPKSPMNLPMRKPPSLSTLAMPSFTGMPPASETLINTFRALIAQLPQENHDLVLTVVQLIKATYQASKDTKMPLSNLLLVFCPSLNMSPPLLKALCETRGIWDDSKLEDKEKILDIRRKTLVVEPKKGDDTTSGDVQLEKDGEDVWEDAERDSIQSAASDHFSSEYHASVESSFVDDTNPTRRKGGLTQRQVVPTIYLDSQSHCSSSSLSSTQEIECPSNLPVIPSPPPLSPSGISVTTPTSSGHPSLSHLPIGDVKGGLSSKSSNMDLAMISESTPLVVRVEDDDNLTRDTAIEDGSGQVQFPTSYVPQSLSQKRRSMSLFPLNPFTPISPSHEATAPESPELRGKKPSLRRLFTRSTASLKSNGNSAQPNPNAKMRSSTPLQYSPGLGTFTPPTPRSATDSSVSTPLSAVTAPQSSTSLLPPVLDLPIETGMSLTKGLASDLGLGLDDVRSEGLGTCGTESTFYSSAVSSQASFLTQGSMVLSPVSIEAETPTTEQSLMGDRYGRPRNGSTASNHLGYMDESDDGEDWTRSVLVAAGAA